MAGNKPVILSSLKFLWTRNFRSSSTAEEFETQRNVEDASTLLIYRSVLTYKEFTCLAPLYSFHREERKFEEGI